MSRFDVLDDPCASCPEGTRIKSGRCNLETGQWLCIEHFIAYCKQHGACTTCWNQSGRDVYQPAMPKVLPNGQSRGWR